MAIGARDTTTLGMLSGWDATELRKFALQDGTPFTEVASMVTGAAGAVANEIYASPLWSSLLSYTDQPDLEYMQGASAGMELFTEWGRADAQRADTQGHMLPLRAYDRVLGWTWSYLKKARIAQIENDIMQATQDVRDRFRLLVLGRMLKRGDDSGANLGLGSAGLSPGFATAAASTGVDFVPPAWGGNTFTSAHEHYVAIAGGVFTAAVFTDAKAELREHGHEPPYDFLIGLSDETTVAGLTGFVTAAQTLVNYGNDTSLATFGYDEVLGSYNIGTIHDFRVRVVPGIPQYYGFGYKSYGANNSKNPLIVRLEDGFSRPAIQVMPHPNGNGRYPLQSAMLYTEWGVGVKDRTAGTPRYVNNAAWSDGTPT